jgi:hypothetical protein
VNQFFFPISVKKYIPIAIAIVIIFALSLSTALTKPTDEEIGAVFTSAESVFKGMKDRNFPAIWQFLSAKTKKSTIEAVYKSSRKANITVEREKIGADFAAGGELAKAYWNSYLNVFDPKMVLEDSKWDIGIVKKDTAEINILYKKSKQPAVLLLYKEDNVWKVGMEETFGARNWLPY